MVKEQSVATVAEIADKFRSSSAAVVTEYRGLTMKQLTQLRRALGSDAQYTVAKNTFAKRAAADAGLSDLDELFTGPTAIAFVTGEPSEAAKAIRDFAKANPLLVVKGGLLDGKPLKATDPSGWGDRSLSLRPALRCWPPRPAAPRCSGHRQRPLPRSWSRCPLPRPSAPAAPPTAGPSGPAAG